MGARVSAKGVTKFGFGKTDPTKQTSSNTEAATQLGQQSDGIGFDVIPNRAKPGKSAGSKAKGGTRTKGGSL
jgi:hypothetical protein